MPVAFPAMARRAASRVSWPFPQPRSSTRSALVMPAASSSGALYPPLTRSYRSSWAAQCSPSYPFHASAWAVLTIVPIPSLPML